MNNRDKILDWLSKKREARGRELTAALGVSRQALNVHLRALVQQGRVVKEGVTRGAVYRIASKRTQSPVIRFRRTVR